MAGIDEKFLSELISKNDIVDVVGKYCVLQKKGSTYWGRCPLPGHSERTPSFAVNQLGQYYHCFGCGKGGNAIKFIEEVESLNFVEAVRFLASNAKIPMPEINAVSEKKSLEDKKKKERMLNILKETALFYVDNLNGGKATDKLEYLEKRKISKATVRAFGLGASLDYDGLPNYLRSKGYADDEMVEVGVCQRSEGKSRVFDSQAERLIIPIINNFDNVIAFGGRVLEDKGFAKYKNTKETAVFIKNRTLFNINNLKKEKNSVGFDSVIMVEGYMDVISLYQAGIRNVVASMGTSLTLEQAKILKRYTGVVYISYDGDFAGQNATVRGLDILENEGLTVKVVSLPDGMDPDDVVKNYGKEGYLKLLEKALPLIDYKVKSVYSKYNLNDATERRKCVVECLKIIATTSQEFLREELLRNLSQVTGVTYESLSEDIKKYGLGNKVDEKPSVEVEEKAKSPLSAALMEAERFILYAIANNKPYVKDIDELYFNEQYHVLLFEHVRSKLDDNEKINVQLLQEVTPVEDLEELGKILEVGDKIPKDFEERYYTDCVKVLEKEKLKFEIEILKKMFSEETDEKTRRDISAILFEKITKIN